jgi:adenine-specific DNA-methyltransferase
MRNRNNVRPSPQETARLVLVPELGHGAALGGNLLIHGNNLPVLRSLAETHAGLVQCIYIDPPYNTGNAFAHYLDGIGHTEWLKMMEPRLVAMRALMRPSGYFFCSIGEGEMAYLKVLCDTVFGRNNFVGTMIWEKKRKPSFLAQLGSVTEYILVYARDRAVAAPLYHGTTTAGKRYPLNNKGNGVRTLHFPAGAVRFSLRDQLVPAGDMGSAQIAVTLLDPVQIRGGRNAAAFRLVGEWRYSQETIDRLVAEGADLHVAGLPFRVNHVRVGGERKKMKNLLSAAHYGLPTYEDAAAESRRLFGAAAFDYPKPERLILTLVEACSAPGDWVLDAFVGSGTTAAVAHKSGRRWIGIESGPHCASHAAMRLRKVCVGEETGGVSKELGWKGGGAFAYYQAEE